MYAGLQIFVQLSLSLSLSLPYYLVVPGTVSEGLNGWSEALTVGLAVWTAKTAKTKVLKRGGVGAENFDY